jgi:hypothetical protein
MKKVILGKRETSIILPEEVRRENIVICIHKEKYSHKEVITKLHESPDDETKYFWISLLDSWRFASFGVSDKGFKNISDAIKGAANWCENNCSILVFEDHKELGVWLAAYELEVDN